MLKLVSVLFLAASSQSRLRIVTNSGSQSLIRSGASGSLSCDTNQPWFLCVWKGPNGLAISKTDGQTECEGREDRRFSISGGGRRCELDIREVAASDAGQYSCVLASKEELTATVSTQMMLNVAVASYVSWVEGDQVDYNSGDRIDINCQASDGFPSPSLVIRTSDGVKLTETPRRNTRMLSVDSSSITNNTVVSCHAEQRWAVTGELVFNSSVETVRLQEVLSLMLQQDCQDWYCGYEIFLFIMLVLGVLIIFSCCGMYFFFATRGKPYNMVMYNSEHGTWNKDSYTKEEVTETLIPQKRLKNEARADIIRQNLNNSLYTQVNKDQKTSRPSFNPPPVEVPSVAPTPPPAQSPPPPVESPPPPADQLNTTYTSNIGDCLSLLSDNEGDSTFDASVSKEDMEEARKRYLMTLTEEEIMFNNTETTLETIYRKYRRNKGSKHNIDDEEEEEFVGETEMRKYLMHKYQLANVKQVKRLGRTYSKVVRDHLSNDPKLTVSKSSVEFEVARPSSALSFCNRSNTSSPYPTPNGKDPPRSDSKHSETHFG